jgi:hypothetical protein
LLVLKSFRLELVLPLLVGGAIVATAAFRAGAMAALPKHLIAAFLAAALMIVALALTSGRSQPVSYYRYTSFGLPIAIVLSIALGAVARRDGAQWYSRFVSERRTIPWAVFACIVLACIINRPRISPVFALGNSAAFATGIYSIDDAYTHQKGWPARMPWGAIHPAARAAYGIVGPGVRIWSLQTWLYCMLPGCEVESHNAFIMTPDWDRRKRGVPRCSGQGSITSWFRRTPSSR